MLLIARRMLGDDTMWSEFIAALTVLMEENAGVVNISFMGFPDNWREVIATTNEGET